jgi:hypothetical protein
VTKNRLSEALRTVKRRVDVAKAFADTAHDPPTRPAVQALVPLDAVPVLAIARTQVQWDELGAVARELLLHVDGRRTAMSLVSVGSATPREYARELAVLARLGIVRLASSYQDEVVPLEIDLSML